jgi:hypothetical protein
LYRTDEQPSLVAAIKVSRHNVLVTGNATLREAYTAVCVDFVLAELDLGVTFCERALSTPDEKTKERNIRNARKAYDALQFLQALNLASAKQALINEKSSCLKGLFEQLGVNA